MMCPRWPLINQTQRFSAIRGLSGGSTAERRGKVKKAICSGGARRAKKRKRIAGARDGIRGRRAAREGGQADGSSGNLGQQGLHPFRPPRENPATGLPRGERKARDQPAGDSPPE